MSGDFIDDFHRAVGDWVEHLGLDGEEREQFIDFCMEKKGYQRATTWNAPEPDPNEQGGSSLFRKKTTQPGARKPAQQGGAAGQYFRK